MIPIIAGNCRASWTPVLLLATCLALTGRGEAAPVLQGRTNCPWGSPDCNPCVPDVLGSMGRLRSHGDILGFHMNGAADVTVSHHWQGVQRLMSGGGRYLAISRSVSGGQDVSFVIVEMASRNALGQRFRSNRLDPGLDNFATPPPAEDRIVFEVPRDPQFGHAGGVQALGNVLAVPVERSACLNPLTCFPTDPGASKVMFYDVTNPLVPVPLANEVDHSALADEAGAAFVARLADQRVLLGIGRADSNILDFYVSSGTDIATSTFMHFDTWNEGELTGGDSEFGNYQSINLVTQCDGALFLVGTHENTVTQTGSDFADTFRLTNGPGEDVAIEKVRANHLVCGNRGVNHCNLDAAGGVYVDPAGEIYVYGTEHDNDGPLPGVYPCTGALCSVKFEEFRPVPHAACSAVSDAWVELYDDNTFGDRSLMIDYRDRFLEDYSNYDHAEGFEDKGSSVRWCLPPGVTYRLWEHKEPCGGDPLDLVGNGTLQSIANLDDVSFGDTASCSQWLGGPFADAGPDQVKECASPTTTAATLDGRQSSDVGGAPLTFTWSAAGVVFNDPHSPQPTGAFPKGTTVVTLEVSSGTASGTDTAQVAVVDTTDPSIQCPAPIAVECTAVGGVPRTDTQLTAFLQGAAATDVCDAAPIVTHDAPPFLPLGATTVTFTATDHDANDAACASAVTVADHTAPEVTVALSQALLWPPDHRLVPITAQVTVTDRCDPAATFELVSITSNEEDDGRGDGSTTNDIQGSAPGTADTTFLLRAERSALGNGRVYTIVYRATDGSGNARDVTVLVSVPREL